MHVVPCIYNSDNIVPNHRQCNKHRVIQDLDKNLRGYFEKISIQATSSPRH